MGVCMCARDYKSHSANGVSVLPAISFHAWQMTMLSAHNTIFLLPRLQHIVLFRKQTFQPILFVMMRGSGCVHAHLGKRTRHTRRNGAEERKHITKADAPKGGINGSCCLFYSVLLFSPCCRNSEIMACGLTASESLGMFVKIWGSLGSISHLLNQSSWSVGPEAALLAGLWPVVAR